MEQIKLNAEVWKKIFASPLFQQALTLFKQIFKRTVWFGDFNAMGIAREEWRRIRGPREHTPLPFCHLILKTEKGKRRCWEVAKQSISQVSSTLKIDICTCHAGLTEVCVPIILYNKYHGYVAPQYGLLLNEPGDAEWLQIAERVKDTGVDLEQLKKAYFEITPISQKLLEIMLTLIDVIIEEVVRTAIETEEYKKRIADLESALYEKYNFDKIIGKSNKIQDIFRLLARVIETDSPVLIEGESGTGKELIAHTIHYNSPRKDGPFTVINCAAFNESLLESELFGHLKGSFTGALRDKKGLFEVTDRGTFFLDEIAEMSPALQVKLLRLLQEGTFLPVGGTEPRQVDVRVISATNKNLKELIAKGMFRNDLYYRLNVIKISLPPLHERKEDIPLLIEHFLKINSAARQKDIVGLKPDALNTLMDYHWPGNIRELQNVIERAVSLANSRHITVDDLPEEVVKRDQAAYQPNGAVDIRRFYEELKKDNLNNFHKGYLSKILAETGGNVTRASHLAGISRTAFQNLLKKYQVKSSDFKE